jgi:hypothetical protein
MILALMQKPDLDTDKVMQLFEIQERYDAKVAREAYYEAITRFRGIASDVDYNRKAKFKDVQYGYATLRHMLKTVTPALEQCGLTPTWSTGVTETGGVLVTCYINHRLGHSESTSLAAERDNSGSKNSIQAVKSTVSYLRRITLEAMLGIAADEKDDDDGRGGEEPKLATAADIKSLNALIKKANADVPKFLQAFSIAAIEELPLSQVARATAVLNRKIKEAKS